MTRRHSGKKKLLTALALIVFTSAAGAPNVFAQDDEKKKTPVRGAPVLWREPSDIASRNLLLGPGGGSMRPDLRRLLRLVKRETGGYSPKYRVIDAAGREWVAKLGKEAQSETAAVRLLWAVGYMTEVNYLARRATIPGVGTFDNVRFEARPRGVERQGDWKWGQNPFTGTREFQGLKVMMMLFNNWDIKDTNNVRLQARGPAGWELRYAISDLGATFGKTGSLPVVWRITRSRNEPEDYADSEFIDEVEDDGRVDFNYDGKRSGIFDDIKVADARWIGGWLARLSNRQIADAFRAANYTPVEVRLLTRAVRARINALNRLPANSRGQ